MWVHLLPRVPVLQMSLGGCRETQCFPHRVFWITDNGSSRQGQSSVHRFSQWYPNAIQMHTPVHASWLNQVEPLFSIVQRKVLTPNDFPDLETLEATILGFQDLYNEIAKPFHWTYSKEDLKKTLPKTRIRAANTEKLSRAA